MPGSPNDGCDSEKSQEKGTCGLFVPHVEVSAEPAVPQKIGNRATYPWPRRPGRSNSHVGRGGTVG